MKRKTRGIGWRVAVAVASVLGLAIAPSIAASADDPGLSSFTTVGATTLSTPVVGSVVSAGVSGWSPTPDSYGFQWYLDGSPIGGGTNKLYKVTPDEQGHALSVAVTANLAGYEPTTSTSDSVTVLGLITNSGASMSGTFAVGQTITADAGTWNPPDPSLIYSWHFFGGGLNSAGHTVTGPDVTSYTLTDEDVYGGYLAIHATLPGYAPAFQAATLNFPTFPPDRELPGPALISGTAASGSQLTAWTDTSTWDPNNLVAPYAYQWFRNGSPIPGASGDYYWVESSDVGKSITVSITAGNGTFAPATGTSAAVVPTKGSVTIPTPTITGTAEIGDPLTAHVTGVPSGYSVDYMWFINGQMPVDAYNGSTYYPATPSDVGGVVTVRARLVSHSGTLLSDPSTATAPIQNGTIHPVGVNLGWVAVGQDIYPTLTGVVNPLAQVTWTIYRDGTAVANNLGYEITASDWGHKFSATVTEAVAGYSPAVTRTKSFGVEEGGFMDFVRYGPPVKVGVPATVDLSLVYPVPTSLSIVWKLGGGNGRNITVVDPTIAHGATLNVPAKYAGHYVYALYSMSAPHVWPLEDFNTEPVRVAYGTLPAQSAAAVSGSPFVGARLAASGGSVATTGIVDSYQWYSATSPTAKPVAIAHATSSSYVPATSLKGHILSVRVTASKLGYTSESTYSAGTVPLLSPTAQQVHPLPPHAGSVPTGPAFL